jgi:DNA-binding LacI/PurR family transcriptional regulator
MSEMTNSKNSSKVTYAEIARVAGVSEATVSRVLNGDERVAADRAKSVQDAVKKLGYKKNRIASALASGKTGLIAVVIDDDLSVFSDPFWATVSQGVSRVLMQNELQTLLMVSSVQNTESPVAHYLQGGEVDGVIFFQLHNETLVRRLKRAGIPVVIAGSPREGNGFIYVDTDNVGGAVQATQHLIERGCKKIATITGDVTASAGRQRLEGYEIALTEAGRRVTKNLIVAGDFSFESGRAAMSKLLKTTQDIDGVFAANDLMASGAIAELRDYGLRIPQDVKVVGFDDSLISQTSRPLLTTVRQDIEGLGAAVAETIIGLVRKEPVKSQILPTTLVVRDSS